MRCIGNMFDLAFAGVELADPLGVNVEADHREPRFDRGERQRNADIAKADNSDGVGPLGDPLDHRGDGFGSADLEFSTIFAARALQDGQHIL